MAIYGPAAPSSNQQTNFGDNTVWSNTSNGYTSNNTYATVVGQGVQTKRLHYAGFGTSSIPDNATIVGFTITVEGKDDGGIADATSVYVQLSLNGAVIGEEQLVSIWNQANGHSERTVTVGGVMDLLGYTPALADVQSSGFGVAVRAVFSNTASVTFSLDAITLTVTYRQPTPPLLHNKAVFHWPLDEYGTSPIGSLVGPRAAHEVVNGFHLTPNNSIGGGTSVNKLSASRLIISSGSSRFFYHADDPLLQVEGTSFTFTGWYRRFTSSAMQILLSKGIYVEEDIPAADVEYLLYIEPVGDTLMWRVGNTDTVVGPEIAVDNAWRFIVASCEYLGPASATLRLSVDNEDFIEVSTTDPPTAKTDYPFVIGGVTIEGGQGYNIGTNGYFESWTMYRDTLSQKDVAYLWNEGMGRRWPFPGRKAGRRFRNR